MGDDDSNFKDYRPDDKDGKDDKEGKDRDPFDWDWPGPGNKDYIGGGSDDGQDFPGDGPEDPDENVGHDDAPGADSGGAFGGASGDGEDRSSSFSLEERLAFLSHELDEKDGEIAHLNSELEIYRSIVEDYEDRIARANSEIKEYNENIKRWQATYKKLKSDNEILNKRIESMQKEGRNSETFADLQEIEKEVVDFRKQDIRFGDVGGIGVIRGKIDEFAAGIKHYEMHGLLALEAPRGMLLHGPPGCGKTMLAMAMANEMECDFLPLPPTRIGSGIVTRSSRRLEFVLQKFVEKYRKDKVPTMIFVDEADGMLKKRGSNFGVSTYDDVVNVWLRYLQGSEENEGLILVAATNRFDMVDDAVVRAGRVNYVLEVPKPDRAGIEDILRKQVAYRHRLAKREFYMIEDYGRLADMLYEKEASGADVAAVLENPARGRILRFSELPSDVMIAPDELLIHQADVEQAIREYTPAGFMRRKKRIGFGRRGD